MIRLAGRSRQGATVLGACVVMLWTAPAMARRHEKKPPSDEASASTAETTEPKAPAAAPAATLPSPGVPLQAPAAAPGPAPAPLVPGSVTPGAAPAPAAAKDDEGRPESVEIQVRRLGDRLAEGFANQKGGGRYERWAVMPFSELGADVEKHKLGQVVSAQLEGVLQADHGFICVERMKLVELVKELQLSQAGLVDETKAPQVGKMAGADVLVVGSVGMLGDRYVVNARAVSVQESRVLASAQVVINAAGLIALSSDAVVLRTRSDAVFRSVLIPGWGQWYNRQEQKGTFIMALSGALLAGGVTFYVLGRTAEHAYDTITPAAPGPCAGQAGDGLTQCVQNQRATAVSRYQIATGMFIGLGAVYAYNVLDAFLFGYTPSKAAKSASFGFELHPQGIGLHGSF